jgi:hypothetical protein
MLNREESNNPTKSLNGKVDCLSVLTRTKAFNQFLRDLDLKKWTESIGTVE